MGTIGRIFAGQIGDMVGPINVLIVFNLVAGLLCVVGSGRRRWGDDGVCGALGFF
jgi:hypothetical protein